MKTGVLVGEAAVNEYAAFLIDVYNPPELQGDTTAWNPPALSDTRARCVCSPVPLSKQLQHTKH